MDTSGKWGRCKSEAARPSSTTVQEAYHTASSIVAAARGKRPAVAAAEAADGAAGAGAAAAVAADGGPVDRRAWRLPTFVAAGARVTRSAREAVRVEADRSTRGSKSAVPHRLARTAVQPAVVCGGTVCGGTASSDCGGNSRADGEGHRGTRRTGLVAAPADSGQAPETGVVQGIGGWPKLAAKGSTMEAAADDKSPVAEGNGRNRVVSVPTSI